MALAAQTKRIRSSLKTLKIIALCLLVILAGAFAWLWHEYHRFAAQPADAGGAFVTMDIMANASFNAVARQLADAGIITHPLRFKILARITGDDKRLKAGEYELSPAMTPLEVLNTLVNGKVVLHRLMVPEGFTAREIAAELQRTGLSDAGEFMALATDSRLAAELDVPAAGLEGYLFPDTYFFPKGVSPRTIIARMVRRFHEQFSQDWYARAQELDLTAHEVVTLASIIEKETGDGAERPIISSVFHNRLKKKMRLESDPTVIYGIEDFDGNITRRHLTTRTPYNTYTIRGLPPGPIANPGRLSIEAALYPAQTDYIYFVSKKDGTHYFSTTIAEHNKAVRRYQLYRRKK
jgi:UPF0755 protein